MAVTMSLILAALLLLLSVEGADVHGHEVTCPCSSSHQVIKARLPPVINPQVDSNPPTWEPMPPGWYYGDWYVAYSSNQAYQALDDLVWSLSPVLPTCGLVANSTPSSCPPGTFPGQLNDLSTWFANSSSQPYTSAFAYDTPRRVNNSSAGVGWTDVWDTVGTGQLSYFQNGWQILAWGYDREGVGYMLNYETAVAAIDTPPCMDILSRVAAGPSNATVESIYGAVSALESADLTVLLKQVQRLTFNGNRAKLPPFVCGPDCVNNTDLSSGNI